ncbi:hypothetical protein C8R45DRAFT_938689 [Mycena sanguinolenta]|nr:hypothetical protein C8R45DRAFT_938689 [Mycena sanguinolenta]
MFSSILLNPAARVYTLRFLLLATIPEIAYTVSSMRFTAHDSALYRGLVIGIACGIFIWFHHILAIFQWTLRGLAVIDLLMEMGGTQLRENIVVLTHVWEWLRGESKYIIAARAVVLSCIGIGITAFGVYAAVVGPAVAVVAAAMIDVDSAGDLPGNATVTFDLAEHLEVSVGDRCVPLVPGSRLVGLLAWSRRQTIDGTLRYSAEIFGLQPNLTSNEANITALTLTQFAGAPIRYLRETADATFLSGIATFGGFWAFVNGAFALFFGANWIGRRPLSALGVVHPFRRRALVRRWYEDFPAIQTEGGLPGSENAGIVAFIRERLVDMGEDPRGMEQQQRRKRSPKNGKLCKAFPWKKKVQRFHSRAQSAWTSIQASQDSEPMPTDMSSPCQGPPLTADTHDFAPSDVAAQPRALRGYILDEIALLDMDQRLEQNIKDTFPPRV